jgi:hypothetical protein
MLRHKAVMENKFTRRKALSLGAAALTLSASRSLAAATDGPVLVELFTSQGCSSCPAADVLAGELMRRKDVIVASLNVDYWDYLGWRDTLAKPEYTKRQFDYARARGDGQSYTPQMVINGAYHAVGSNRAEVDAAIIKGRGLALRVPLRLTVRSNEIRVAVPASDAFNHATLYIMAIAPAVLVKIERGENSGRSVTYHNVARKLSPVGMWNGKAAEFQLPRKALTTDDSAICLAVLQAGEVGEVIGLAHAKLTQA